MTPFEKNLLYDKLITVRSDSGHDYFVLNETGKSMCEIQAKKELEEKSSSTDQNNSGNSCWSSDSLGAF